MSIEEQVTRKIDIQADSYTTWNFFQFSNKVESVCIKQQDIGILENNANRKLLSCVVFFFVHIFVISPKWEIIWTLFLPLNVTMNVVKGKFIPRLFEIFLLLEVFVKVSLRYFTVIACFWIIQKRFLFKVKLRINVYMKHLWTMWF